MCTDCVSVLWAQGTPRGHFLPEYGLRLLAGKDVAVLERPKKNVHGTEASTTGSSDWGRTAIACLRGMGHLQQEAQGCNVIEANVTQWKIVCQQFH